MKSILNNFLNLLFPPVDSSGNETLPSEENEVPLGNQIIVILGIIIAIILVLSSA